MSTKCVGCFENISCRPPNYCEHGCHTTMNKELEICYCCKKKRAIWVSCTFCLDCSGECGN